MNPKEFFAKAKGTILEEEIDVLFNLYCVYKDIRPAYLHYSRSKEISTKSQIDVIKKLFPFFKTTYNKYRPPYSKKVDKISVIIHINDLPPFDENIISPHTVWIGKVLGYSCPGQMGGLNPIIYSFGFKIVNEENIDIHIYSEICWKEESFDYSKVEKFKDVVRQMDNYRLYFEKKQQDRSNKLHIMSLKKEYFYQIARGEKKVELRLYDEKRKQIKKNDIIEFKCNKESFRIKVKDVKIYGTFLQGLKSCTLKKTLPGISTYDEGVEIYHSISNYKEKEKKYGVCAIILDNMLV